MHHGRIYEDENRLVDKSILDQRYAKRFYQIPSFSYHVFQELKLPSAPMGHPLADGHASWAAHLLQYIENNNLFNSSDL
jgi:hypothetical protein